MSGTKILGIVLLVAGLLGLLYGHFDYTKETHEGQIGPFKFSSSLTPRLSLSPGCCK